MNTLRALGRILFAVSIAVFGIQYVLYGRFVGGLPPVPPWAPGRSLGSYLVGAFLMLCACSIATKWKPQLLSVLLGLLFLISVIALHTWHFTSLIYNGVDRTRALEPLTIAGGAFVLAGTFARAAAPTGWDRFVDVLARAGLYIFAVPMIIFGMQHFEYAPFLANLVPAWLPAHLFWIYFTGFAFIAAAVAMCLNILGRLAAIMLGVMFVLWFVILHLPRAIKAFNKGDEWSSAFVALAFAGLCFVVASTLSLRSARNA
jgi:uncharacterized membrane protein